MVFAKVLDARWPRVVIRKQLILGFCCDLLFYYFKHFSTVLRKKEKGGEGSRAP